MSESLFQFLHQWWMDGVRAADEFAEAVLNRYGWTAR